MPLRDPAMSGAEPGSGSAPMVLISHPVTEGLAKAAGVGAAGVAEPVEVQPAPFSGPEWVALGLAILALVVAGSLATACATAFRRIARLHPARLRARRSAIARSGDARRQSA
jgi:hypothetical protein